MGQSDVRGFFIWYELLTSDPEEAISFYKEVIGWETQQWEAGGNYTMFTTEDDPIAGVLELPEEAIAQGAAPNWLPYMGTPDVDATALRVTELGGRVLKDPADIPSVGRFAVLADPQGAAFAIYRPESERPGAGSPPTVGRFSWHELATTDHQAAFRFYEDLFGWEIANTMDLGEMGEYQIYARGGLMLGGMFDKPDDMPGPPAWLCYVMVDDLDARIERVKKQGGQVLNGPMEVPGGDRVAQCLDSEGAPFALHSRAG